MTATLFAVLARTPRGREAIARGLGELLPATFPRQGAAWWRSEHGVALHAPLVAEPATRRGARALALVGTRHVRHGRTRRSWSWPQRPASPEHERASRAVFAELRADPEQVVASWRGELALAYWDGPRQQLTLARDPLGQRGLFLRDDVDVTWVCSELAPLIEDPGYACQVDLESAVHYLQNGRPPWGRTLADGVLRVPPAHVVTWRPGQPLLRRRVFTALRDDAPKVADDAVRDAIRAQLDDAIAARLTPGRQALLLSGGVDSSYLAARGAALVGGAHFDAYTIEFAPPFARNETAYARLVADRFGLRHHVVPLDLRQTRPLLARVLEAAEPCAAWATVTHHQLLARLRQDGHTAVLSGLGSDEVFGGYWHYLEVYLRWRKLQRRWPRPDELDAFDSLLWTRGGNAEVLFASNARFFDEDALRRALLPPFSRWRDTTLLEEFYREQRRIKPGAHWFELAVAHECEHRIPELLLANFEPISRQAGLRCDYPFLDPELLPLVCGLGAASRFARASARSWSNKVTLRQLAAAELPDEIMRRPLTSYTAPVALWLGDARIRRDLLGGLRRSALWKLGLVRPAASAQLVAAVDRALARPGRGVPAMQLCSRLWALITLAAWIDRWVGSR